MTTLWPFEFAIASASSDRPVATVTFTDLVNDFVEAVHNTLSLTRADDGLYRFAYGSVTQRCPRGRGHRTFTSAPCA